MTRKSLKNQVITQSSARSCKRWTLARLLLLAGMISMGNPSVAWQYSANTNFWDEDIWKDPNRGFLFYGTERSEQEEEPRELASIKTLPELKVEVKKRLETAVMDPSEEHLTAYLEANTFLLQKSMDFAQSWQQTQWGHPAYDFTVTHPNANFAQIALKEDKNREQKLQLADIREDWALVFIVQAGCRFCDMMAPIAKLLEEETGLTHLALHISPNKPMAWPQALPENGTLRRLIQMTGSTLTQTPAVFMVRSDSQKAYLIATGALSVEELTHRVLVTAQKDENDKNTTNASKHRDALSPLS